MNRLDLVLAQHLVALQVHSPVACAAFQREVCLFGKHLTAFALGHVPRCLEGLDLRIADSIDQPPRIVLALADRHHELVDQWKKGPQRLLDRVSVLDCISGDGEAGELHKALDGGSTWASHRNSVRATRSPRLLIRTMLAVTISSNQRMRLAKL